jgi:hypothetical protein
MHNIVGLAFNRKFLELSFDLQITSISEMLRRFLWSENSTIIMICSTLQKAHMWNTINGNSKHVLPFSVLFSLSYEL